MRKKTALTNKKAVFTPPSVSDGTTAVKKRLVEKAVEMINDPAQIKDAMFHHSIFCQTYLPYKDPGDDVTLWEQKQGNASLAIQTMKLKDPISDDWLQIGLPYGTRARLILAYINTQAVKSQSQVIDVEDHLSAFVKKLGLTKNGRTIGEIKEQIRRITASIISLGFKDGDKYIPINFGIVKAFDLWFQKEDNQRVAWTSKICLTDDYFNSLMHHAIPLDERAIAALAHSAMAIDVYTWLVQRLHRIPHGERQFITWLQLKEQFGQGYGRMDHFKTAFRTVLKTVLTEYHQARNSLEELENKGFYLSNAATPIDKKMFTIPDLTPKTLPEQGAITGNLIVPQI
jgi:hypothetical protein